MKKILGGLFLFSAVVMASAQTISFEKTTIDYGTVPPNADGNRVFTFKNTGDKPLILSNVQPACGCTSPEWTKEPIMPGKVGKIKVHYNTAIVAPFNKTIDVFSNDPANGRVTLVIKGNVDANAKAENGKSDEKSQPATPANSETKTKATPSANSSVKATATEQVGKSVKKTKKTTKKTVKG